jgi:hypothetical protein
MQLDAVQKVSRASARVMKDTELVQAHNILVKIHATNFAGNEETESNGLARTDVVKAAAVLEEELERRSLLGEPGESALYQEATTARENHIRRSMTSKLLMCHDGTFIDLPGGAITIENQRTIDKIDNLVGDELLKAVAKRWSPDGSRFVVSSRFPAEIPYHVALEMNAQHIDGVDIDEVRIERGASTDTFDEFFVVGKQVRGILKVFGQRVQFVDGFTPYVFTEQAKADGWMPPDGESALPAMLELDVPVEMRYWKAAEDSDPIEIRDMIVTSGLMKNVGIVDGEFRRIVTKHVVPELHPVAPHDFASPDIAITPIEMASEFVRDWDNISFLTTQDAQGAVESVKSINGDYLLEAPYAESAIDTLSKLGRPFVLKGHAGCLFVASVPIPNNEFIIWKDAALEIVDVDSILKQEPPGTVAQTLIFDKKKFTREQAIRWAKGHNFKADKVDETENSYRLRQRAPGDFARMRTISITDGVQMVVGVLKQATDKSDHDSSVNVQFVSKADEKAPTEERIVFGVVLEPDIVDSQSDTYDAETIKVAAYKYMEQFQNTGFMHKVLVNQDVKILESYLAPVDMTIEGRAIKKGTWLMAVRVLSDVLWKGIQEGKITGYSIGGYAVRTPEGDAAQA